MGLTIHYRLATDRTEIAEAQALVREMRRLAQQLPFLEIGEIIEFKGDQCGHGDRDDEHRWLKIQAHHYLETREGHFRVAPLHVIAFSTLPGEGCEPANFGL